MASLFVQNAGRQQCGAGCGWGPGVRDHFVLQHILSGKGSCVVDGQRHALEAGDSFQPMDYFEEVIGGDAANVTVDSNVDTRTPGSYQVTYSCVGTTGVTGTTELFVVVE